MPNKKTLNIIAGAASLLALCLCVYLVQHHYGLMYAQLTSKSVCNVGSVFDCDTVNISKFSELFGIPVALWGVFAFGIELLFLLGAMILAEEEKPKSQRLFFYTSVLNILFSLYLATVSTLILKTLCLFCISLYILSLIIFVCAFLAVKPLSAVFKHTAKDLNNWMTVLLLAIVPVGSFITDASIRDSYAKDMGQIIDQSIFEWQQSKKFDFFTAGAPTMGNPDGKLKLVVFSDFECPFCKRAAPSIQAFAKAHKNDVFLTYQNYPLDSSCNPKGGMHKFACLFARAAVCAHGQGKYLEVHDWIYDHQETLNEELIKSLITENKLDEAKFNQCLKDPATAKTVSEQLNRGTLADIHGTPSVFANGKLLPYGFLIPILEKALQQTK